MANKTTVYAIGAAAILFTAGCTATSYSNKQLEEALAQRDQAIAVLLNIVRECGCIKDKEAPDPE